MWKKNIYHNWVLLQYTTVWFLPDIHVHVYIFYHSQIDKYIVFFSRTFKSASIVKKLAWFSEFIYKETKVNAKKKKLNWTERRTDISLWLGAWNKIPVHVNALRFLLAFEFWSLCRFKDLLVKTIKWWKGYRLICSLKSSILLESNCKNTNKP